MGASTSSRLRPFHPNPGPMLSMATPVQATETLTRPEHQSLGGSATLMLTGGQLHKRRLLPGRGQSRGMGCYPHQHSPHQQLWPSPAGELVWQVEPVTLQSKCLLPANTVPSVTLQPPCVWVALSRAAGHQPPMLPALTGVLARELSTKLPLCREVRTGKGPLLLRTSL